MVTNKTYVKELERFLVENYSYYNLYFIGSSEDSTRAVTIMDDQDAEQGRLFLVLANTKVALGPHTLTEIAEEIIDELLNSRDVQDKLEEYLDCAPDLLVPRFTVGEPANDVLHYSFGKFSIIPSLDFNRVDSGDGSRPCVPVTAELVEQLAVRGYSVEELFDLIWEPVKPALLRDGELTARLEAFARSMGIKQRLDSFRLQDKGLSAGASVVFKPGCLDEISQVLESGFYAFAYSEEGYCIVRAEERSEELDQLIVLLVSSFRSKNEHEEFLAQESLFYCSYEEG